MGKESKKNAENRNNLNLDGKVALVVGGGRGIGAASAIGMAEYGADIILIDHPKSKDLDKTANTIQKFGRNCTAISADVFNPQERKLLFKNALKSMFRIDILVTGPASSVQGKVTELSTDDFSKTVNNVLTSHFEMGQLAAKQMIKQNTGGKIIFIGSVYGFLNRQKSVAYDAAKAGLHQMAQVFARELAQYQINVNAVAPGFTDTPGERYAFSNKGDDPEEEVRKIAESLPFGRAGTPKDVGNAVAFLASPMADYITGQVLIVDGGMSLVDFTYSKSKRI